MAGGATRVFLHVSGSAWVCDGGVLRRKQSSECVWTRGKWEEVGGPLWVCVRTGMTADGQGSGCDPNHVRSLMGGPVDGWEWGRRRVMR